MITWIAILALAQLADLVTTAVDMANGGVEANLVAGGLLAMGGLPLLWAVKMCLVAAMGGAAYGLDRHHRRQPGPGSAFAHNLLWRGIQGCVLVLAVTAVHNAVLLPQFQG